MSKPTPASFGEAVRLARKRAGLTQEELGAKLGMTNAAISGFERGASMPSVMTVVDLAAALGVPYGVLFGEPLALAEYAVAQVRAEVRALGYDVALIPRAEPHTADDRRTA